MNKPEIGETTHILDPQDRIKILEKSIENLEDRERRTQGEFCAIKEGIQAMSSSNAKLRNQVDNWRRATIIALIGFALTLMTLYMCLTGVI